ncbi:hypothetical protein EDM56_18720 [Brevibacillus fluminis]|uniref:Uncharacterized protein n=1 Tax=Brevibacillus fluminis TaxID=511487 RepID=A0A3M8DCX0_9BACL|nr:hypothetical protein [Brevibacillus fluminis]RNB85439.1 hypothetical protein EDM56_18720 [Brevibacillus fluminis]
MKTLCPICNGFTALASLCPNCSLQLQDTGRLADYYGDYSPYREIDDAKKDNGYPDLSLRQCMHVTWCSLCQMEQIVAVDEWASY